MLLAYHKAAKGKRGHAPAAEFEYALTDKLIKLQRQLRQQTYHPSAYTHFFINEPKRRKISAAPFRDRVVHHALCNIIEPVLEACFIVDSYANRIIKGTHAAIDRAQAFAYRYRYVLRMDIVKHFPSLDHQILFDEIASITTDEQGLSKLGRQITPYLVTHELIHILSYSLNTRFNIDKKAILEKVDQMAMGKISSIAHPFYPVVEEDGSAVFNPQMPRGMNNWSDAQNGRGIDERGTEILNTFVWQDAVFESSAFPEYEGNLLGFSRDTTGGQGMIAGELFIARAIEAYERFKNVIGVYSEEN